MAINVGSSPVQQVFVGSSPVREVWVGSELVWQSVVYLSGDDPGSQLIDALTARGLDYRTVTELPFGLDTSQVTDMSYMFWGYQALTTVPAMDTSQVTDMSRMFFNCSALTAVPDMDTSQVTNMSNMFFGCSSLTAVPDMDTSQVTNMSNMFRNCSSLTQVPDLDASSVTDTSYMFYGCSSLVDGSVRLIRPDGTLPATQTSMIAYSGLTRVPFYNTAGNPI